MYYQAIRKKQGYVVLLVCLLLNSCPLPPNASLVQNRNVQQPVEKAQNEWVEEAPDLDLLESLVRDEQIIRPFAWGSWDDNKKQGEIVGIDREGRLKSVLFAKTDVGYSLTAARELNKPISSSGRLNLREYLTDREFPFKSDIVEDGSCRVHFVLVRRALNRSFRKTLVLQTIDLRIIVERHSQVVSSEVQGFRMVVGLRQAFIKDINGDGAHDYVFVDEDNYKHIRVWSVQPDCTVKPIRFKEDHDLSTSVPGRELFLQQDRSGSGYSVHTRMFDPIIKNGRDYWEVTETVYTWDKEEAVYKKVKESTRIKRADSKVKPKI